MNARTGTALALAAGIAVGSWWLWSHGLRGAGDPGSGGLSPDEPTAEGRSFPGDLSVPVTADEPRRAEEAEAERIRIAADSGESNAVTVRVPADTLWIDCRLVVPGALPADEELIVEARGEEFASGDLAGERDFAIPVKVGVPFRLAFAPWTRQGEIRLKARYHYLDPPLEFDVTKVGDEEIVIEPELGGVIRGRLLPPAGVEPTEAGNAGVTGVRQRGPDSVGGPSHGMMVDMSAEGTFELRGLAPGIYDVFASSEHLARTRQLGLEVFPGEASELVLELARGVRVSGQVIGLDAGLEKPTVSVNSTDERGGRDSRSAPLVPTGEEGTALFECRGLPAGEIVVRARLEGYLEVELELGEQPDGAVIEDVRLELDRGLALEGQVRWPDGSAAGRATVRAFGRGSSDPVFVTTTDADGRFQQGGLRDGRLKVVASAEGPPPGEKPVRGRSGGQPAWTAEQTRVTPGTTDLVLVLDRGESVTGRVVDDEQSPVTSFRILAVPDEGIFGDGDPERSRELVSASFENEDGRFLLEGLHPGKWRIVARSSRHADSTPQSVSVPDQGPELELVVARHATIRGLVLDPSGAAVPGARVEGSRKSTTPMDIRPIDLAKDRTDAEGRFVLRRVDPGEVDLVATAPGYGGSNPHSVRVGPGEELEGVHLRLLTSGRILGRIDPASGRVALRTVRVVQEDGEFNEDFTSDSSGQFTVEDLMAGSYWVVLFPEEPAPVDLQERARYYASCTEERAEIREGETVRVVIGAPPARAIALCGRVLSGGEPQAGWVVKCVNDDGAQAEAWCDDEGRFSMTLESPGKHLFGFWPSEFSLQRLSVQRVVPDRDTVELEFELPEGSIAGLVRLPGGAPALGCPVMLELVAAEVEATGWFEALHISVADPDGSFQFGLLPPGTYVLRAGGHSGDGEILYGLERLAGLRLGLGEAKDGLVIDLRPAGSIEGLVLAPDGSPAVGARVTLVGDGDSSLAEVLSPRTDSRGRFDYRNLGPGRVAIQADLGDLVSEEREVRVIEGESVEVQLQLK